jgi:CRP/FNR family transcriptional regulator, cyclic AMP receptor protein
MMMRNLIRKVPLFSELDDRETDAVMALVSTRNVPRKSIVVQEGDVGDSLFVILKGSVKISSYTAEGKEVVLSLLGEGGVFGEMALLDRQPRSATVSTMEDSSLAQIRRPDFERLLLDQPSIALKLLSELVSRLRRTTQVLERISTMDVPHRLYNYILDFCLRHAEGAAGGAAPQVRLPTHQLIADQLSTSRETISRAISTLKKEGIIIPVQGRSLVRIDMQALETLAEAMK